MSNRVGRCTKCHLIKCGNELSLWNGKCEECRSTHLPPKPDKLESGFKSVLRQQEEQMRQSADLMKRFESMFEKQTNILDSILREQSEQSNYLSTIAKKQVEAVEALDDPNRKLEVQPKTSEPLVSQRGEPTETCLHRLMCLENVVNKIAVDVEKLQKRD